MTDSCERCGSSSPEALLRNVELRVDGSDVADDDDDDGGLILG